MKFESINIGSTYLVDFTGDQYSESYSGPVLVIGFSPKGYKHDAEVIEAICDDGEGNVFIPEDFVSEVNAKHDDFKQKVLQSLNISDMVFELARRKLEGKDVRIALF